MDEPTNTQGGSEGDTTPDPQPSDPTPEAPPAPEPSRPEPDVPAAFQDATPAPGTEPIDSANVATTSPARAGLHPKLIGGLIAAVLLASGVVAALVFWPKKAEAPPPPPRPVATASPSPTLSPNPGERSAVLRPVGGTSGEGVAVRTVGNEFSVRVTAQLPEPRSGSFYEAYLARTEPAAQFSIGRLQKVGEDWVVTLTQARDASAYGTLFVSLESADDKKPEQKVLEGAF